MTINFQLFYQSPVLLSHTIRASYKDEPPIHRHDTNQPLQVSKDPIQINHFKW